MAFTPPVLTIVSRTCKLYISKVGSLLLNCYSKICKHFDNIFSIKFTCSIGDIMLYRKSLVYNQLLISARLLDVENYEKHGVLFTCQNTISRAHFKDKHNESIGNKSFASIISSYKKNGYLATSTIDLTQDLSVINGTHRAALNIYYDIENISVRVLLRSFRRKNDLEQFLCDELPSDFIETIHNNFRLIQNKLIESGNTFVAVFAKSKIPKHVDVISDMKKLANVLHVKEITDSIGNEVLVIQFSLSEPNYRIKRSGYYSLRAVEIEKIMKMRMGDEESLIISKNCIEGYNVYRKYVN